MSASNATMTQGATSKELVRRLFSGARPDRVPFLPWVSAYAARLEQIPASQMLTNPDLWAKSLRDAAQLFGYDGVVVSLDESVIPEVCGCAITWGDEYDLPSVSDRAAEDLSRVAGLDVSQIKQLGRLPVALGALEILKATVGRSSALLVKLPGPLDLAAQTHGPDVITAFASGDAEAVALVKLAARITLSVVRAFSELGPDLVVLVEEPLSGLPVTSLPRVLPLLRPIWNLVRFYDAAPVLASAAPAAGAAAIFDLEAEAVVAGTENVDLSECLSLAARRGRICGVALPAPVLSGPASDLGEAVKTALDSGQGQRYFLTSDGDVPVPVPPENMHQIVSLVTAPV